MQRVVHLALFVVLIVYIRGWSGTDHPDRLVPHRIYNEKDSPLHSPNEIVTLLIG